MKSEIHQKWGNWEMSDVILLILAFVCLLAFLFWPVFAFKTGPKRFQWQSGWLLVLFVVYACMTSIGDALGGFVLLGFLLMLLLWPLFVVKTWPKRILLQTAWTICLSSALVRLTMPFIINARYAAEPIPITGHLRTQLALYQYEHGYLPGDIHGNNGLPRERAPSGMESLGGALHPGAGFLTQTFRPVEDTSNEGAVRYEPALVNVAANLGKFPGWAELTTEQANDHYVKCVGLDSSSFMGKLARPHHFQYWSPAAGVGDTNVYAYALGCFGDGNGLRAGTGYARLEIWNGHLLRKAVASWQRYSPEVWYPTQIYFVSPDENPAADLSTTRKTNYCWVPRKSQITTKDPKVFDEMLKQLKQAGWEF